MRCVDCGSEPAGGVLWHLPWCKYYGLGWRCPVCGRGLAPNVKECSCKKVKRSGVLDDSLAWIYEDFTPPEA